MDKDPLKIFTLGFVFDASLEKVLLMHKSKPEWQAGKVNGLGGKVEMGESALACIAREVREESGLVTEEGQWVRLGAMRSAAWVVDVFAYVYEGSPEDAISMEIDPVEWFEVKALPQNAINNLYWMVPLALDKIRHAQFGDFSVEYDDLKRRGSAAL